MLWKVYSFLDCYLTRQALGFNGAIRNAGGCGPALRVGCDRYMDLCFPGSTAIRGPKAVSGRERGSLTVQCHYVHGWETYKKWWCRGADWNLCTTLVKTTGSEQKVKQGRVSIMDNQRDRVFIVTMDELRQDDADTYWCGIERTGVDLGDKVKVTIDPAPTTVSTTTSTTTTTSTAPVTPEETQVSPTLTSYHSDSSGASIEPSVLIPLIFAVLLLLLVAAALLAWRVVKRQKKAPGISPEQVLQPLESDLCYANLTLQQTGTSPRPSRKKASRKPHSSAQADQVEVEYVTMAPFPMEDISYAALSLDTWGQEPTYSNMSHLITHTPSRSHEEPTEYSAIRKP
ncbi:PREDICTED: CMRF35-like molecule 1 [Ceratotherium simum simum]|uniref:CMRF35-like molecule 1 n=1 Tax=Ceratotherium simum simum TaxID=73337 RepID=A0ABM1CYT0_CERSS|nr:PREDICTED: CMRF35-like molecule 1 [Ceratotherium simum simum]